MSAERYERLMEALTSRVSCRRFSPIPVPQSELYKVVEAALWTPSAHNLQRTYVVRVANAAPRARLRDHTRALMGVDAGFDPFYGAPEVFAVMAVGKDRDLCLLDGALTAYNMMLAASALGLGSCWVNTAQYETDMEDSVLIEAWHSAPSVPDHIRSAKVTGVGYVVLGFPGSDEHNEPKPRIAGRVFTV